MKRIFTYFLLAVGVLSAMAVNPQWEKFRNLKYRYPSANFEAGQFQSITGRFDGKTLDTLTLYPLDGEWEEGMGESGGRSFMYDKWILISKNGTVPSKSITSYYPTLVYEGDLDGNGRDEFAVMLTGHDGAWCKYNVYTLYGGKVNDFLSVDWWDGNDEDYRGIVTKGAKKGVVKYNTYGWTANMENIVKRTKTATVTKFLR